jgi:hypothetical protein
MHSAGVIDFIGSMRESETVYSLASIRPNITIRGGRRDEPVVRVGRGVLGMGSFSPSYVYGW